MSADVNAGRESALLVRGDSRQTRIHNRLPALIKLVWGGWSRSSAVGRDGETFPSLHSDHHFPFMENKHRASCDICLEVQGTKRCSVSHVAVSFSSTRTRHLQARDEQKPDGRTESCVPDEASLFSEKKLLGHQICQIFILKYVHPLYSVLDQREWIESSKINDFKLYSIIKITNIHLKINSAVDYYNPNNN